MKKLLTLTMALVMVLTLAACGGQTKNPDVGGGNPGGVTTPGDVTVPNDVATPDVDIPDEITYSFADGVLTVSGRGEILKETWYSTVSDVTYEASKDKICDEVREIVIENGATAIGEHAFSLCHNLTKITIPDSVTYIGEYAFSGCSTLASVEIPDSVTFIGKYAFNNCESLTDVTLPSHLASIELGLFDGCSSLTHIDIPESVTAIGASVFDRTGLTEVTIPANVTEWGMFTFNKCDSLMDVTYLCDGSMDTVRNMFPQGSKQVTIHAAADSFIAGYLEKQHSEGSYTNLVFEPLG